jgi:hypothetical protein
VAAVIKSADNLAHQTTGRPNRTIDTTSASPNWALRIMLDGRRLNVARLFSTITNYLHYPLSIWILCLLAIHQPEK